LEFNVIDNIIPYTDSLSYFPQNVTTTTERSNQNQTSNGTVYVQKKHE